MTKIECPLSIRALKEAKSFLISWKCSPWLVRQRQIMPFLLSLLLKEAFILCASPESVEEDCPN
jgi:hypothetical protein